jgi:hypothetical protein
MAHTSDRTLLASLGFADADKKDRRHTLACQYLCEPDVGQRLWARVDPEWCRPYPPFPVLPPEVPGRSECEVPTELRGEFNRLVSNAAMEVAVTKERGFLVGFWDVVIGSTTDHIFAERSDIMGTRTVQRIVGRTPGQNNLTPSMFGKKWAEAAKVDLVHEDVEVPCVVGRQWTFRPVRGRSKSLHVEVKAGLSDVADIARQIETYRTAADFRYIVVATCYPMPAADKATLAAKKIHHVYLGDGFKAYCKARESEPADVGGDL